MNSFSINNTLSRVSHPSRYLGCETNTIRKDPAEVELHMALAFPDVYEIGTSHFGLQILYHILNEKPEVFAERVFAPGLDMAGLLKDSGMPLFSLETQTPLSRFDILGFSLLYELNYTNILLMLDLAGIPFYSADRNDEHPVIIAGGPCTVNPEPVAPFFDAMVIGDGEDVVLQMSLAFIQWKQNGGRSREELLKSWSGIEGVYVPAFFAAEYDSAGHQKLKPLLSGYECVSRAIAADLDQAAFPGAPVIPFGRPVHDRLRLEIARGCTRGCRFCQAGMIYRPVRERSPDSLLQLAEQCLKTTGYEELSLLSLSTGDYSCLTPMMKELMEKHAGQNLAVSVPSFRAGTMTPEMMELIRQVRKTGFTIAPEAGSDRLRRVINKGITEDQITETVSSAFDLGWQVIKLYFMIGLPTETDEDLDAIIDLVHKLKKLRRKGGRRADINVSAAVFIPKSHTPFQWTRQIDVNTARDKIEYLRRALKIPGVQFKWPKPETSLLEGLFARGDRRLSHLLVNAYENGCRFDGWTDCFDYAAWQNALVNQGIDTDEWASRTANPDASLPWDHIDVKITRDFLRNEYERAIEEGFTPDCRQGDCQACGICDFKTITPRIAADGNSVIKSSSDAGLSARERSVREPSTNDEKVKVTFARRGSSRFFGHLELVNIMIRAVVRADLPVAFSSGFHPKPKIAFEEALPVGMESICETFQLTLTRPVNFNRVVAELNRQLPEGLRILDCRSAAVKSGAGRTETASYRVCIDEEFDAGRLDAFLAANDFELRQQTKKGKEKLIDLKELVTDIRLVSPQVLWLRLKNQPGASIRPAVVLRAIFGLPEEQVQQAHIIKFPDAVSCEAAEQWITKD